MKMRGINHIFNTQRSMPFAAHTSLDRFSDNTTNLQRG